MKELNLNISNNLIKLAKAIKKAGGNVYIVGGYVRNALLELANTDMDICGNLTYDKVLDIANNLGFNAVVVNKKLGTVLIKVSDDEEYEYTTFRKENYSKGGNHSPDDVDFVTDIKLDASRRDFTANSLYYDILTGEIKDFYSGLEDIENKVLRCIKTPEEVFESDGLRILRLIRIANELGFSIDQKTRECAKTYAHQLCDISGERVLKELKKIVVSDFKYDTTDSKENFLDNFNHINFYKQIFDSKFDKFTIGMKYRKEFFNLPKNFRYMGFWLLFLANYFGFRYIAPAQVVFTCNTYLGASGLKESNNNIATIVSCYNIFQEIIFNKKRNYRHIIMDFYNSDSDVKKFLEAFVPEEYITLKKDVKILRDRNIPLSFEELNITNTELINEARIEQHITSKIRMRLLLSCINEDIANTKDNLIAEAKYLNIKILNSKKA